ncbi:MAG: sodium:proton antiporter [Anaerolineales bacterium]|jgi:multicomponent Na+:H+ antiporter subunit C|nr:sodium:proton antiporter [Anaerolineales bacterium]WKZ39934.1 MAG: sodium:proton antiporter [Anaerolineales bacterium]
MNILTALAIGILFATGIYQMLRRNVLRAAIGLVLISNAINLFLFTAGAYNGNVAAYTQLYLDPKNQISDPLPQALVLTAIVISAGGFALVLSLLYVIAMRYKTSDSDEVKGLKN